MIADDLNLETKIKITDKEFDFELWGITKGTVTEIKLDGHLFALVGLSDKPTDVAEKTTEHIKKLPSVDTQVKSPNNTMLFLNWLKEWMHPEFDVSDFTRKYPTISKEQAMRIITHQIKKEKLDQLSAIRFKILKRDDDG